MLRPGNATTPAFAATVVVPASVQPAGFVAIATVTLPLKPVAVLPKASRAVICTAGVIAAPVVVVPGCAVNSSRAAGPAAMANPELAPLVSPLAVASSV